MEYKPTWDMSTIPDRVLNGEYGRRQRAKGPRVTYVKYKPCAKCSKPLTATQRRKPCPHCGQRNDPRARTAGSVAPK